MAPFPSWGNLLPSGADFIMGITFSARLVLIGLVPHPCPKDDFSSVVFLESKVTSEQKRREDKREGQNEVRPVIGLFVSTINIEVPDA